MGEHTIHERDVEGLQLPGRFHKMVVKPENMRSTMMCAGVAFFPGNSRAPEHVHQKEEEILYVLAGQGFMYFDGKREEINPGTFMVVHPGTVHSLESTSKEDLKVLYFFSPPVVQGSYDKRP